MSETKRERLFHFTLVLHLLHTPFILPLLHKMNMVFFLSLFFYLLRFTAKCQEPPQLAALRPPSSAVHVEPQQLNDVSGSVLAAETWLRNHVLAHYPSTNITTIVVGSSVLCHGNQQHNFGLILPSIKNLHHSLTRWGLHREIKVAAAFSPDCLDLLSVSYRDDVVQRYIKPLLAFLRGVAADPPPPEFLRSKSMQNLGHSEMHVVLRNKRRKLSHKTPTAPSRSPSVPSFALPPLIGTLPPEPEFHAPAPTSVGPPFTPHIGTPTYGPHLPPCEPSRSAAPPPAPAAHAHHGAWCVAKPSVPAETLQEALDYACGEGEADCEAIKENGDCFYPDSLVAHASYAFNSYWQKTKTNGGSCGFGGTAMLITSDPSYGRCRFSLN